MMFMSRNSLRRSAVMSIAATTVAAGFIHLPSAQAATDMFTHITPAQCKQAHNAIAAGQPLPDPSLFRRESSSLKGDTLHLYMNETTESLYGDAIRESARVWTEASQGKIKFQFHDQLEPGVVDMRVEPNAQGAVATAGAIGTDSPYVRLGRTIGSDSQVYTIAHELGHQLGLNHSCSGDIMKAGTTPGAITLTPTATDAAAVTQDNPAFS